MRKKEKKKTNKDIRMNSLYFSFVQMCVVELFIYIKLESFHTEKIVYCLPG